MIVNNIQSYLGVQISRGNSITNIDMNFSQEIAS